MKKSLHINQVCSFPEQLGGILQHPDVLQNCVHDMVTVIQTSCFRLCANIGPQDEIEGKDSFGSVTVTVYSPLSVPW